MNKARMLSILKVDFCLVSSLLVVGYESGANVCSAEYREATTYMMETRNRFRKQHMAQSWTHLIDISSESSKSTSGRFSGPRNYSTLQQQQRYLSNVLKLSFISSTETNHNIYI